ncbi:DUF1722 domain-containing protein [Fictibacillus iocasae]|uniref:DUF1722 domain-containing protein n=1 Tax=Fictibacillus iocasae TaxID=2715437 RepID=A0ABW2NQL3_9BACL
MKKSAQQLWTVQKYNVMAKGYHYYKNVQSMVREAETEEDFQNVISYIQELESLSFEKKAVINTFEHIWGYFKKSASKEEKEAFFKALKQYRENGEAMSEKPPAELIDAVGRLLETYPSAYLENSAFLKK